MKFAKILVLFVIALMTLPSVSAHADGWTVADYKPHVIRKSSINPPLFDPIWSYTNNSVSAVDVALPGAAFIEIISVRVFTYTGGAYAPNFVVNSTGSLSVSASPVANSVAKLGASSVFAPGNPQSRTLSAITFVNGGFVHTITFNADLDAEVYGSLGATANSSWTCN